jgi:hypothetical protein
VLLVLTPRPAVLPSSVGLPPHPHPSVSWRGHPQLPCWL